MESKRGLRQIEAEKSKNRKSAKTLQQITKVRVEQLIAKAIENGDTDMLEDLMSVCCYDIHQQNLPNINLQDKHGFTALAEASEKGAIPLLQFLIENSANINLPTKSGHTPLSLAAINGQEESLQCLLKAGQGAKYKNSDGVTLLMLVAYHDQLKIAEIFIGLGCDVHQRDSFSYCDQNGQQSDL